MTDVSYTRDETALLFVDRPAGQHLHRSTGRFAMELGYHVTLVKDATATFSKERMRAAYELNGPNFAHAIVTTDEMLAALSTGPEALTPRPSAAKKLRLQ